MQEERRNAMKDKQMIIEMVSKAIDQGANVEIFFSGKDTYDVDAYNRVKNLLPEGVPAHKYQGKGSQWVEADLVIGERSSVSVSSFFDKYYNNQGEK
jgi:hypothetical protein